ncbi:MAG TPA: ABC transporter substrate-binding protein [Candidatus Moranbacteria bacterium]|nr:ABC transporter substrate-binding protein [Candidatus Moranbacteria bacterium]
MKSGFFIFLSFIALVFLTVPSNVVAQSAVQGPKEVVAAASSEFISVMEKNISQKEKKAELGWLVDQYFDLVEMGRRSLGPVFKRIGEKERSRFLDLFPKAFSKTNDFVKKIFDFQDEKIRIIKEETKDNVAVVYTNVIGSRMKDDGVSVNYRLILKDGKWKIYDILIEDINWSCILSYKDEFSIGERIRGDSISGLLAYLEEKINKEEQSLSN